MTGLAAWMEALARSGPFLSWLARASLQGAVVAALIMALGLALRPRLAPRWSHGLWLILVLRLALPWTPASALSVYNWIPVHRAVPAESAAIPQQQPVQRGAAGQILALPGGGGSPLPMPAPGQMPAQSTAVEPSGMPAQASAIAPPPAAAPAQTMTRGETPAAPSRSGPRIVMWLALGWLGGALAVLGAALAQSVLLARAIRRGRVVSGAAALDLLAECRRAMGVRRAPRWIETPAVRSPALCGAWRPSLLMPEGTSATRTPEELRHVLLHELAHLKRRDIAFNWLLTLVQAAHWFNPLVWIAFRQMRADRELVCDAMVLARLEPREYRSYGETIIRWVERASLLGGAPGLAPLLENRSQIQRRITMIAQFKQPSRRLATFSALLTLLLACSVLTSARPQGAIAETDKGTSATTPAVEKRIVVSKVPVLSSIPLVGRAFMRTTVTTETLPFAQIGSAPNESTAPDATKKIRPADAERIGIAESNLKRAQQLAQSKLISQNQLAQAQTDYRIAVADAHKDPQAASAARLELAEKSFKRMQVLASNGVVSQDDLNKAETDYAIARADANNDPKAAATARLKRAEYAYKRIEQLAKSGIVGHDELVQAETDLKIAQEEARQGTQTLAGTQTQRDLDNLAKRDAATPAEAVAKARLGAARQSYDLAQQQYKVGMLDGAGLKQAESDYKIAEAEAQGDPQAVAKAQLEAARSKLQTVQAQVKAGVATEADMAQAQADLKEAGAQAQYGNDAASMARMNAVQSKLAQLEAARDSLQRQLMESLQSNTPDQHQVGMLRGKIAITEDQIAALMQQMAREQTWNVKAQVDAAQARQASSVDAIKNADEQMRAVQAQLDMANIQLAEAIALQKSVKDSGQTDGPAADQMAANIAKLQSEQTTLREEIKVLSAKDQEARDRVKANGAGFAGNAQLSAANSQAIAAAQDRLKATLARLSGLQQKNETLTQADLATMQKELQDLQKSLQALEPSGK